MLASTATTKAQQSHSPAPSMRPVSYAERRIFSARSGSAPASIFHGGPAMAKKMTHSPTEQPTIPGANADGEECFSNFHLSPR